MNSASPFSRREFLQKAATLSAIGFAAPHWASAGDPQPTRKPGPDSRIHLGLIGCGEMGRANLAACEAGKDFYLQKPMMLHLGESLAVRNAVKKHNVISQIRTQVHAGENYRRVVEFIRAGNLGPVGTVRTFNVMNQGPNGVGHRTETKPPEGLDWDFWCGPAPKRPFNPLLAANAYNHCSWMDYSGGWTPGMAPHIIDLPVWALDLGFPIRTSSAGGRFVLKDDGDAYDHHEVLWQFPNLTMTWMSSLTNSYGFDFHGEPGPKRRLGIYFHGAHGTIYSDYGSFKVMPEGDGMKNLPPPPKSIPPSPGHEPNGSSASSRASNPVAASSIT